MNKKEETNNIITFSAINSKHIVAVEYNKDNSEMVVEFKTATYTYGNVEIDIFESFISADSLGKFYHKHIKSKYKLVSKSV